MVFVACGLNHKTAPLDLREKVALPVFKQDLLLHRLTQLKAVNEAAILSTCNRTEIYCDTEEPEHIASWLAEEQNLDAQEIEPHFYSHLGPEAVRHTLRVAAGLDSMMLGEPQILGQLKQSYRQANRLGTVKTHLRQVFQYIFSASKRIRTLSGIGNNPISVAFAAVQLIGQTFKSYKPLRVLIIGSGETSTLVAKYLHKEGVHQFLVAGRNQDNTTLLAESFDGEVLSINDIPEALVKADVIISATACPLPFISKHMVQQALNLREGSPLFFLDLAVPRDIESNVSELNNVHLYNIDDLQQMTLKGMDERRSSALYAEALIDKELSDFLRWQQSLTATDLICTYRQQMKALAEQELQRAIQQLSAGKDTDAVLSNFSDRLVNKLTHAPSVGLRQAALDGRQDLVELAQYLFNTHKELTTL